MSISPPSDWPHLSSGLCTPTRMPLSIGCRAFGFRLKIKVEDDAGGIAHNELVYGHALIMVAPHSRAPLFKSPLAIGGVNTQALMLYFADVDAHSATARTARERTVKEPATSDYGAEHWSDRSYEAIDLEGHP